LRTRPDGTERVTRGVRPDRALTTWPAACWSGAWNDGFIHAGNLAYMTVLAIFPFFITGAALFSLVGEEGERAHGHQHHPDRLAPVVGSVIGPVARRVIEQSSGWLLWIGGWWGCGPWAAWSETIRDILRPRLRHAPRPRRSGGTGCCRAGSSSPRSCW
jgi:membrane protein